MTIARLNGEVIAESSDTIVLDGKHYFPPRSVRSGYFRPVRTDTSHSHYYAVNVNGHSTECACCDRQIPDPRVADHIRFDGPVVIEED
ncbi:MAG: DUF427 domain-containing protein [Sciscionella sp.]